MKNFGTTLRTVSALGALAGVLALAGCASLDQNLDASIKQYAVPGKVMHVADMNNYPFCEIGLITGTSEANAVLNIWNTTSVGDCPPDKIDAIFADQGAKIKAATGAQKVWLNPRRHWTFNEIWAYSAGDTRDFEGVKGLWLGVVGAEVAAKAVGAGHYLAHTPGTPGIVAHRAFKFKKGMPVYLLDMPDGKVFVMQSWTNHATRARRPPTSRTWAASSSNCRRAGSSASRCSTGPDRRPQEAPYYGYVTQDEFLNTYQGCGFDDTCNFVP